MGFSCGCISIKPPKCQVQWKVIAEVFLLSRCQETLGHWGQSHIQLAECLIRKTSAVAKWVILDESVALRSIFGTRMGQISELSMLFMSGSVKAQSARVLLGRPMSIWLIDQPAPLSPFGSSGIPVTRNRFFCVELTEIKSQAGKKLQLLDLKKVTSTWNQFLQLQVIIKYLNNKKA